jgi:hypothetical protein
VLTSRYARVVWETAFGLATFVTGLVLHRSAPVIVYKAF